MSGTSDILDTLTKLNSIINLAEPKNSNVSSNIKLIRKDQLAEIAEDKKNLEPVFFSKSPAIIKYATQTPSKTKEYTEIPREEFAKENNFEWTDSILIADKHRDTIWQDKNYNKNAQTAIEERLHNPLTSLVVAEIDEKVGKGVFLAADAQPIPAGTVVGIYAGMIEQEMDQIDSSSIPVYGMSLADEECQNWAKPTRWALSPRCSADKHGNIFRFVQDLPSQHDELDLLAIDPVTKSNISTENLMRYPTVYNGCPVIMIITTRLIGPGEMLGFSYGEDYWKLRGERCVFNKNAEVIGHFKDSTIIMEKDYEPTKEMAAPRVDVDECKKKIRPLLVQPSLDQFDYKLRFVQNIDFALTLYQKRFAQKSAEYIFLNKLKDKVDNTAEPDEKFKELSSHLKSNDFVEVQDNLKPLRAELVFHMNKYNQGKLAQIRCAQRDDATPSFREIENHMIAYKRI